jgi:alpha-beta hydrolase superfamily lysophospholipase
LARHRRWLLLCWLLLCAPIAAKAREAPLQARQADIAGAPGTLISSRPIAGGPKDSRAYRILYRSIGLEGEAIAVSGMAVVPRGEAPAGGRPVVAWAHPTSGLVERCAPSLAGRRFEFIAGLKDMVGRGFVVVATDYPGLGTAGPHPYLVGASEGRAVLDSVRAVRLLPGAGAGARFAVWGHSQGGHAALFAGLMAPSYAPEFRLVGVAAAAPATDLATLFDDDLRSPAGRNIAAMTLWSWARVFDAPIEKVLDPAAAPTVDRLARLCIESVFDILARRNLARPLAQHFLADSGVAQEPPWKALLAANTPGPLPADVPVFLSQGGADHIVRPEVTAAYMKGLCAVGEPVRMVVVPDAAHGPIAQKTAPAAVAWISDRFAGQPAPSDCPAP